KRICSSALTMPGERIALVSPSTKALRKRSMSWPYSTTSNVVASVQSALKWARQMRCAATALSQSALNSAQVFGRVLIPAFSIALVEAQIQLMRWIFIGAATQWPAGFMTGRSSGATTLSQPSLLARSSRLAVMPVAFHSAISGPLSCTAGGALPATTSARSLASVLAVWPAIEVCAHFPPAAVNMSPSLAIAAASEPCDHWLSRLVLGSAIAAVAAKAQTRAPAAAALIMSIVSLPLCKLNRAEAPLERLQFGPVVFGAAVARAPVGKVIK